MTDASQVHEQALRSLVLQHEGEALVRRYQRLVDAKDIEALADIITDDVIIDRVQDGERRGREAFLDLYRRFAASDVEVAQHMVTNVEVAQEQPDTAKVDSCFLALTTHGSGEARAIWGRYHDGMVHDGSRWLLSAKRISVVRTAFIEPSALASPLMDSFGRRTS